jgi:hypothetical protein
MSVPVYVTGYAKVSTFLNIKKRGNGLLQAFTAMQ